MMSKAADIPESVMEDAIGWFDDLRQASPVDNEAFTEWLMRSPTHVEAFLSIAALHGGLAAAGAAHKAWLESLLGSVSDNVWPLEGNKGKAQPAVDSGSPRNRNLMPRLAIAASVMLMVTAGFVFGVWPLISTDDVDRYTTAVGEQRTLVLEDGSLLQLNTNTSVTVHFSDVARDIVLLSGEAMFKVKKDSTRPFRVQSGEIWVQAIGTRFNVYRQPEQTEVTVIEGRVAVGSPEPATGSKLSATGSGNATDNDPPAVELSAGEQLAIRRDGTLTGQATPVDTERATAWTQRRVVFDNDTLAAVASEFNRYNRDKLVIADPSLQERRISGVFTINDPQSFAEVLASMTPVRFEKRADGSVRIVSADHSKDPTLR